MDKMLELEAEYRDQTASGPEGERRRWVQVYGFSYNESLTACVAELEQLERFTKLIVGEQGFDDYWEESDSAAD
ncbi:hypothetical protein VTK73DRAFT_4570 [Phialemonium thermophilum]|uniref:Uncharacterized protein n=1 Tax=Phialemonium thermophilum TaxID=223376 RepID=A0ABR3V7I2_9PEZI